MNRVVKIAVLLCAGIAIACGPEEKTPRNAGTKKQEVSAMGHFVIVCYRPKAGKEAALVQLVRDHVPRLRKEGLVTEREGYAMRAKDGTIVEVFEWKSVKATEEAHSNPAVQQMWKEFGEVSDYDMIGNLPEAKQMFSGFEAIDQRK